MATARIDHNKTNQPNYYAVIPAHVRYCKDLEPNAKLIYGEIARANISGTFLDFKEMFDRYGVSERSINIWIDSLVDKGFIIEKIFTMEQVVSHLCSKKRTEIIGPLRKVYQCSWCHSDSYILSEHHHPIPKKDNGKETVKICSNCHEEFHFLFDNSREIYILEEDKKGIEEFLITLGKV